MVKVCLGDVARERKDSCKSGKDRFPNIGLEHLSPQDINLSSWDEGKENTFTKIFRKGDVLFGRRRAYLKKAAVAPFDGICSGDITVIEAIKEKIVPELLPFIIQNDDLFDYAVEKSAGSLSPRVKWEHLKKYEFNLPSYDEQKKLAKVLWAAEETRQLYKKLLGKMDEIIEVKFIEMFGSPDKITEKNTVTDAFSIRNDLRKPLNDAVRSTMHTGDLFPYYGANGQVDTINKYLMDCTALCLAEDCGAYGKREHSSYIIHGKSWVNNHAHVLIPNQNCNIEYANIYFFLLDITKYISGTTRSKLTQGQLKKLPMLLPPIELQNRFADFVKETEQSKDNLQKLLNNLNVMTKALINEKLK